MGVAIYSRPEDVGLPLAQRAAELLAHCLLLDDVNPAELSDRVHRKRDFDELGKMQLFFEELVKRCDKLMENRKTEFTTIWEDCEHDPGCWKMSLGIFHEST